MTSWLPDGSERWGGQPVARTVSDMKARRRAVLTGVVRTVVVRRAHQSHGPLGQAWRPGAFDAWLDDGTGSAVIRWLGRESVPGIVGGARLTVEGTASEVAGQLVIVNPMYRFEADA